MFTVQLAAGVCMGYSRATARTETVRQAVDFISEFAPGRCGVIASCWIEQDRQYVMEVFDWIDCWFSAPPVLARVIAPPEFRPQRENNH